MAEKYLYERNIKQNADYNVQMAFPGCKAFALSSLGYLYVCKEIDKLPYVNFEPLYSDSEKTSIRPQDVDLIGFSLSFDLDFLEIFKMLEKYNIPPKAKDRGDTPLIFGGGPVLTANPMPYVEYFDFIIIGDGEDVNTKAIEICHENKDKPKAEILKLLSHLDGVYVPSLNQTHVKKMTAKLSKCIYTTILSEESFFKNTFIMEIARGCSNRCGFCIASYTNLPIRFVDYQEIIDCIELGLKHTNKIALLGALIGAHPHFKEICEYIYNKTQNGEEIELTFSSLRADLISPIVVKTLIACGQKHSTIAIEAASERLRKVVNKNLTEEQIVNAVKVTKENGLKGLKIYCMLGLPTETQEDINEFLTLAKRLKTQFKGFNLSYSFSSFVPKPHTPFQWCKREDTKSIEQKQKYLKKEFHKLGIEATFSSAKWDFYQTVTSRGGKELGEYIYEVYKRGGNIGAFKGAYKDLEKEGKLPPIETYTSELAMDTSFPWDMFEIRPGKDFLKQEHERLLKY